MKATTIKLEGELLEKLEAAKPAEQSLTAYVRTVLQRDLNSLKIREAAAEYKAFVNSNDDEQAWLEEWDQADLNSPAPDADAS